MRKTIVAAAVVFAGLGTASVAQSAVLPGGVIGAATLRLGQADSMGPAVIVQRCWLRSRTGAGCSLTVDQSATETITLYSDGSKSSRWRFEAYTGRTRVSQRGGRVCARWIRPPWKPWRPMCFAAPVLRSYATPIRFGGRPTASDWFPDQIRDR